MTIEAAAPAGRPGDCHLTQAQRRRLRRVRIALVTGALLALAVLLAATAVVLGTHSQLVAGGPS